MNEIQNTEALANFFNEALKNNEDSKKPENLKYVIYARKSTDEKSDKQVRSIGDQIAECKKLADLKGLKVVDVVKEAESAKEPDIRPKFRQMLDDVASGKYSGIIAWHPDRLARNMKDAGEIIDLIDKRIIWTLRFCKFHIYQRHFGKNALRYYLRTI